MMLTEQESQTNVTSFGLPEEHRSCALSPRAHCQLTLKAPHSQQTVGSYAEPS